MITITTKHATYNFRQVRQLHEASALELVDINGDKSVMMHMVPNHVYAKAIVVAQDQAKDQALRIIKNQGRALDAMARAFAKKD